MVGSIYPSMITLLLICICRNLELSVTTHVNSLVSTTLTRLTSVTQNAFIREKCGVLIEGTDDFQVLKKTYSFFQINTLPLVMFSSSKNHSESTQRNERLGVVFWCVTKLEDQTLEFLSNYSGLLLWHPNSYHLFLVTSPIYSDVTVESFLRICWNKYSILNTEVVADVQTGNGENASLFSLNPFVNDGAFSKVRQYIISLNKMSNVYGYKFTLLCRYNMIEVRRDAPSNCNASYNEQMLFSAFVKHINGTEVSYYDKPPLNSKLDYANYLQEGTFERSAYPYEEHCLRFLVPKARHAFLNIDFSQPFSKQTWIIYVTNYILLTVLWKLFFRRGLMSDSLIETMRVSLFGATNKLPASSAQRVFTYCCLLCSMLTVNMYSAVLKSDRAVSQYYPDIDTPRDLHESKLHILTLVDSDDFDILTEIEYDVYKFTLDGIEFTADFLPINSLADAVSKVAFAKDQSVLMPDSHISFILRSGDYVNSDGYPLLHMAATCVQKLVFVTQFAAESPFLKTYKFVQARIIEAGINKKWINDAKFNMTFRTRNKKLDAIRKLNLNDIQLPFRILYGGLGAGLFVFLAEKTHYSFYSIMESISLLTDQFIY